MNGSKGIAAVTGASGYLGSRICQTLEAEGWEIRRLLRSGVAGDPRARRYDVAAPIDPHLLDSVDLLVHSAYDFSLRKRADIWRVNVDGTRRLLAAAKARGVHRLLVLSTMSAYEGTTQLYGRAKLDIEAATIAADGCVIRPGLVYSSRPAGMAGALQKITRLPIVPLIAGSARQYPVHLDDLMNAIAVLAVTDRLPGGPLGIAQPTPVPFREVLVALAAQEGRTCRFVTVPWQILYWGLRAAEGMRVRLPFRADSLLGLVRPAPSVPGADQLASLGVTFRPFEVLADAAAGEPR